METYTVVFTIFMFMMFLTAFGFVVTGLVKSDLSMFKKSSVIAMTLLVLMVMTVPAKADVCYDYGDSEMKCDNENIPESVRMERAGMKPETKEEIDRANYGSSYDQIKKWEETNIPNKVTSNNGYYDYDPNEYNPGWDQANNPDRVPEESNNEISSMEQVTSPGYVQPIDQAARKADSETADNKAEIEKYRGAINQAHKTFPAIPVTFFEKMYAIKMGEGNWNVNTVNALTNGNVKEAINKLNANSFKNQNKLYFAPSVGELMVISPKPFYGRKYIIGGYIKSAKSIDTKFDKSTGGNMFKNGIRSVICLKVEDDINFRQYEVSIYSTKPATSYKAGNLYKTECMFIGTTTPINPHYREPVFATNGKSDVKLTQSQYTVYTNESYNNTRQIVRLMSDMPAY